MRITHLRTKAVAVDEAELQQRFKDFEEILHSFIFMSRFFPKVRELDDILQQANQ